MILRACAVSNPFLRRLAHGAPLTAAECAALVGLTRSQRSVGPRRSLVVEAEPVPRGLVVLEGWACRSKVLRDGQRQITDLLLPGDIHLQHAGLSEHAGHALDTLSTCTIAEIDPGQLAALIERWPGVARALRWSSLQTESILREALTNNGRRSASRRLAHLICEILARLRAVGMVDDGGFAWPLTQDDLGDVTSMTSVHVNRMVKELRTAGLIVLARRRMTVLDAERLAASCDFRPEYLHLAPGRTAPAE